MLTGFHNTCSSLGHMRQAGNVFAKQLGVVFWEPFHLIESKKNNSTHNFGRSGQCYSIQRLLIDHFQTPLGTLATRSLAARKGGLRKHA